MAKTKKIIEDVTFFEALSLLGRIKERKMTLKSLRAEVSEEIISIIKDRLIWIVAEDENFEIDITAEGQMRMTEYHAMMVLGIIKKRMKIGDGEKGMGKVGLESDAPKDTVDFLKNNKLIFFKKTDREYPNDQIVHVTEKGEGKLEEYFKNQ